MIRAGRRRLRCISVARRVGAARIDVENRCIWSASGEAMGKRGQRATTTGPGGGRVTGALIMMPSAYFVLRVSYSALWQSFGVLTPTIHVIFTVQCH